jgi:hypothetical protein
MSSAFRVTDSNRSFRRVVLELKMGPYRLLKELPENAATQGLGWLVRTMEASRYSLVLSVHCGRKRNCAQTHHFE